MRVLAFTTVFPNPVRPQHGLFVLERLRHCANLAELRVIAPRPALPWPAMGRVPQEEERAGLAVAHPAFRYVPRFGKWLDGLFLYLSALGTARRLHRAAPFDLIDAHFGYPDGFAAILLGRRLGIPVTITLRGTEPLLATAGSWRRRALRYALRHADRLIAVSEPLAKFAHGITAELPGQAPPVTVIANGVDLDRFDPARTYPCPYSGTAPAIVFTGTMGYRPNVDAVCWFAAEVLPRLRALAPAPEFHIVGANPAPAVQALAALPGVHVTGTVPDVRPYLAHAAVAVAPLRIARGIQNKVLEALAMACPVVATPQAFEGVRAEPGRDLLVAGNAPGLATCIAEVLERRHPGLGAAGRAAVAAGHDWPAALRRLDAVLGMPAAAPTGAAAWQDVVAGGVQRARKRCAGER